MGVYIDMEMPKDGYIDVRIKCNGTASFAIADNPYFKAVEAVPVPPHGRLIDADALMEILSKVIDINASIEQRNEATDQERRCLWWFEQQIGIAPTIIEAEEGE